MRVPFDIVHEPCGCIVTRCPAHTSGEGAAWAERVYCILRALREPEPTSGVRVGALTVNETVAYDAIMALLRATPSIVGRAGSVAAACDPQGVSGTKG